MKVQISPGLHRLVEKKVVKNIGVLFELLKDHTRKADSLEIKFT